MGALASQASERSTKAVRTSKPPLAPNPRHREPTNPKTVHGNVYCDRTLPIVSYALTVWYDPFTGLPAMQMWDNCLRPRCPTFSRGRIRAYANSWSADAYPRISSTAGAPVAHTRKSLPADRCIPANLVHLPPMGGRDLRVCTVSGPLPRFAFGKSQVTSIILKKDKLIPANLVRSRRRNGRNRRVCADGARTDLVGSCAGCAKAGLEACTTARTIASRAD